MAQYLDAVSHSTFSLKLVFKGQAINELDVVKMVWPRTCFFFCFCFFFFFWGGGGVDSLFLKCTSR